MTPATIKLYRYRLPLKRTLTSVSPEMKRHGLIVEMRDDSGHFGYGECAPLPGFSRESIDDATDQLKRVAFGIVGYELPQYLEELSGAFERWLKVYDAAPSVRFAIESAALSLIASGRAIPLARLISDEVAGTLPINALLSGDRATVANTAERLLGAGFTTFKLKVGNDYVEDDITMTRAVRAAIGDSCGLRLDANRRWSVNQAIDFWNATQRLDIEYIEEPVTDHAALVKEMTKVGLPSLVSMMLPPTALDESIVDIDPDGFVAPPGVRAIILKPTLLGLERAMRWARKAIRSGLKPVVTSSYETSVGLHTLANFAASLSPAPVPMGLATLDVFEKDLLDQSVSIIKGTLDIDKLPDVNAALRRDLLEEVSSYG